MKKFYQWRPCKNRSFGSNLIELLLVLAIITVIVTISLPSLKFFQEQSLINELNQLQIICNYLQKKSIYSGKRLNLQFNSMENAYYYELNKIQLAKNIKFDFIPGAAGPPAQPTGPISAPITFLNQKIIFYPNGTVSSGTVYLTNDYRSKMYALTISVNHGPFFRKYKYHSGSWIYLKT